MNFDGFSFRLDSVIDHAIEYLNPDSVYIRCIVLVQ